MTQSPDADWRRKLQQSETRRAEMVMENHRLKDEVDQLRVAGAFQRQSTSPSRYATVSGSPARDAWTPGAASLVGLFASPIHKGEEGSPSADRRVEALEKQLHEKSVQLDAAQRILGQSSVQHNNHHGPTTHRQGGVGFVTIAPLPQASEEDYGFAEEDHAKQCAEEIMARLLRALHAQREAQDKLAAAQLTNVRLQSLLDESRGREVVLSQMMGAYSEVVNSGESGIGTSSHRRSSTTHDGTFNGGGLASGGPQQVEAYLQQCVQNLTRLDGVKRRLIDEKLKEVTEECARLKENKKLGSSGLVGSHDFSKRLLSDTLQGVFQQPNENVAAPQRTQQHQKILEAATSQTRTDIPLLSDEHALLVQLLERDREYQSRMQKMKEMIIEKEKQNQDLKKLLVVKVAHNAAQQRRGY